MQRSTERRLAVLEDRLQMTDRIVKRHVVLVQEEDERSPEQALLDEQGIVCGKGEGILVVRFVKPRRGQYASHVLDEFGHQTGELVWRPYGGSRAS